MAQTSYVTLGGQSKFVFDDVNLSITTSRGKTYYFTQNLVSLVKSRYVGLSTRYRLKTSQYTDPLWQNCPQRILAPYLAKLISIGVL